MKKLLNFWRYATTRSGRSLAELEAENERLRGLVGQKIMDQTVVRDLYCEDGSMYFGFKGGAAELLAQSFGDQFIKERGINYVEVTFDAPRLGPSEKLIVTLQKMSGKTPHQLREDAERRLYELRVGIEAQRIEA